MKCSLLMLPVALCAFLLGGCATNDAPVVTTSASPSSIAVGAKSLTPKGTPNFTSKNAGFAIYFPVKAVEKQSSSTSEWGNYQTFICQSKTTAVSYVVIATTIPTGARDTDSTHFLDGMQKGMLKSSKATLQKSQEISLNGTPGRELYTSIKAGGQEGVSRSYMVYTPEISYQIMAIGLKKEFQGQAAQIEKVLSSFRLTGK